MRAVINEKELFNTLTRYSIPRSSSMSCSTKAGFGSSCQMKCRYSEVLHTQQGKLICELHRQGSLLSLSTGIYFSSEQYKWDMPTIQKAAM